MSHLVSHSITLPPTSQYGRPVSAISSTGANVITFSIPESDFVDSET